MQLIIIFLLQYYKKLHNDIKLNKLESNLIIYDIPITFEYRQKNHTISKFIKQLMTIYQIPNTANYIYQN